MANCDNAYQLRHGVNCDDAMFSKDDVNDPQ
jgi:hypothetical protein